MFNYVSGPGRTVGQELQDNPDVDGWTFTGSYDVGMTVFSKAGAGRYPRPAIIEMGGKNPTIVSNTADANKAAMGVMRAAFGLDGQKCSACSRVYVQSGVYDDFKAKLVEITRALKVGDPSRRDTFMGTVVNKKAFDDYQKYMKLAHADGNVLVGRQYANRGRICQRLFC